ncbi:ADP-ribosylglycohydrolase family protein [Pseudomonas sp. GL-RE-26]|uniref:ADP-ribosylglycohydrolase family protein n=1 Tax=Pseudomonas sp. GL-RE-26 TaxID=2832390 RepID=UPI001CBD4CDB|nr:ADP-ribosylglycohydrolase family protein [Pseudomonas sp. GL-RE-26]
MPVTLTPRTDAILGCLYGQAIGDALGMPSELWPQARVRKHFGWIDSFLPGPEENVAAAGFIAGQYTDDTEQAIALTDALIECGGQVVPEVIARHILDWALRMGAFDKNILGPSSKAALLAIRGGQAVASIVSNGVTNGAAMRVAPLGCLVPTADRKHFIEQVVLASSPTHKSDIAVAGAGMIAWCVSRAIEGADWGQIKTEMMPLAREIQTRLASTFSPCLALRTRYALDIAAGVCGQSDLDALTELYESVGAGMDTLESVPCAVALVDLARTDPVRCAILAANLGGDTDTIGAMATAICGALHGAQRLPDAWKRQIAEANQIDLLPYALSLNQLRHTKESRHAQTQQ